MYFFLVNPFNLLIKKKNLNPYIFDIEELGPFDSFGEGPFFNESISPFTITCITKALLI